jgi:hypothetical protein
MGCSPPNAGNEPAGGARGTRRGEPALSIHPLDPLSLRADGEAFQLEDRAGGGGYGEECGFPR